MHKAMHDIDRYDYMDHACIYTHHFRKYSMRLMTMAWKEVQKGEKMPLQMSKYVSFKGRANLPRKWFSLLHPVMYQARQSA